MLNDSFEQTAVGAGALLNNITGPENVAVGFNALNANDFGGFSVAVGYKALETATGAQNTAVGDTALQALTTGTRNTAVGDVAGLNYTGSETSNVAIGAINSNGSVGVAGDNNTVRIADNLLPTDVPTPQCFIGGIAGHVQVWNGVTVCQVTVDFFGHLGVDCLNPDNPRAVPGRAQDQAMLNDKVEELQAAVAQLTAQLKEQAAQIQKVSAKLEVSKPAPQVVVNKP